MLTKKDILNKLNDEEIETKVLIKSYGSRPTKQGSKYFDGMLEMQGSVPFKVWAGELYDALDREDYTNVICYVKAVVNKYNGNTSLVLKSITPLSDTNYSDYFESRYNEEAYWNAFNKLLEAGCSKDCVGLVNKILEGVSDRFKVEFAARSHHDAFKGGLLAHSYRVLYIMSKVIMLYPNISKKCNIDLLIMGSAIHDLGKVFEYTNGAIEGNGLLVSHRTSAVEYIVPYKEEIVGMKGEEFYYRLLAIFTQHHGEYEETPRCIEAYLIHLIDNLESLFESIDEGLEKGDMVLSVGGFKLV